MDPGRTAELGRISAAIVTALAEAQDMAGRGELGAEFRELLQHVRKLHELALEAIGTGPDADKHAQGLAVLIGNKLRHLEGLLVDPRPPLTLQ